MAVTRAICPELTSGAMRVYKLTKGERAEAGERKGQHQSYKAESCWKGSRREREKGAGRNKASYRLGKPKVLTYQKLGSFPTVNLVS